MTACSWWSQREHLLILLVRDEPHHVLPAELGPRQDDEFGHQIAVGSTWRGAVLILLSCIVVTQAVVRAKIADYCCQREGSLVWENTRGLRLAGL